MTAIPSPLTVSTASGCDFTPHLGTPPSVHTELTSPTTLLDTLDDMPDPDDHASSQEPPDAQKSFICSICNIGFARQSHLTRHRQSHLPQGQQKRVTCNECGRSFSRGDVCLRHTRKVHHERRSVIRKGAAKSCQRCRQKKLKCDRSQPCSSCSNAKFACTYLSNTSIGRRAENTCDDTDATDPGFENRPSPTNSQSYDLSGASPGVEIEASNVDHTASMAPLPPFLSDVSLDYEAMDVFERPIPQNFQGAIYDNGYELYPFFNNHIPTMDETMASFWSDYTVSTDDVPRQSIQTRVDQSIADLDWVDQGLNSPGTEITSHHTAGHNSEPQVHQPQQYMSAVITENRILEHIPQTTQPSADANQRPLDSHTSFSERHPRKQEWPFDHTPNSEPYRCQLPPLREVLQSAIRPRSPGGEDIIKSLIQLLSVPRLPEIDHNHNFQDGSAINLLKRSLELYIAEFHSILPIIHVPTFEINTCPTVLLAAMACTGSLFSNRKKSPEDSWSLSEISIQMITWLGGSDSTNHHDPAYISACLIHQIYCLGSGNPQLYQNADGARGTLFASLRGMNLLRSSPCLESEEMEVQESRLPLLSPVTDLSCEWLRWRDLELNKRITWAAFEYDCSLCTLSGRRGAVDLLELPSRLPCAESLWEAPTAQAWAALVSHLPPASKGVFLTRFLRDILARRPIPNRIPAWSKRICAQIIGRLLWDLKQLHTMSLSNFLGLPALAAAQTQTKVVLLNGLLNLRDSMAHPASTSDIIHLNITSIVCHYSHLYASEEMMDLVIFIFRGGARERGKQSESELDIAKRRLSTAFAKNLRKTRRLVWHAAQIIAMAREYLVHAPCETMRVFMGHIFILSFAKFCPLQQDFGIPHGRPVRLDYPTRTFDQKTLVNTWIIQGGPASIGAVTNIHDNGCVEALKQEALLLMREMRVWKLADKFCRILESFDADEG